MTKRHPSAVDQPRLVEVDPGRILRWMTGFAERHGPLSYGGEGARLTITAVDGAVAVAESFCGNGFTPTKLNADWLGWAVPGTVMGLVLVRRGGYAVGLADVEGRLSAHKCGTRYTQSRTAAGGWSQQRFARRRGNQADELVGVVADHSARVVLPGRPGCLVVGGDKVLVREVLADPRLRPLLALPRRELYDLPDPRLVVLEQAVRRGRTVRITLTEPGTGLVEAG